jgi:hypothetical protein
MAYRFQTNLAQALTAGGLHVIALDGWKTRGRPSSTGNFTPVGVLWHHTGPGVFGLRGAQWMAREGRSDLPAPLCQLSIDRDGTVYVLAAGRANHAGKAKSSGTVAAGDGNALYIGVECMNSGTEGWSKPQYDAMVKTGAVLARMLGTSVRAQRAHKETSVTGKWDPGMLDMNKFRADIAAVLAAKSAPKPAPAKVVKKAKRIRVVGELTIAHGNLFKDNTQKGADVALLDKQTAHVFGLNEAYRFRDLLKTLKNYRVIAPGTGAALNNVILLRHDITWLGEGWRKMCDKVGTSPERTATWALYQHAGHKWAHIQTHTNAHIEDAGKPRNLPRVAQDIIHMRRLTALVKELRAQGYRVTIAGDFNWHWKVGKVWTWAPRAMFARLGMRSNWITPSAPTGGSLGSRRIDYLAHDDADLRIASQHIISGEHSDHRWLSVTYRVVA